MSQTVLAEASYRLGTAAAELRRTVADDAAPLATALSAIDPWAHYGATADRLAAGFHPAPDGVLRHTLWANDERVGIVIVRNPWLVGPYVAFLGIRPAHQGLGYGAAILDLVEREARAAGARNLWICVSHFNVGAQALYIRQGFREAAHLEALSHDDIDELLLRKRL